MHITAVDMSFCTSLRSFIQIGPPSAEKKWRHVDFQDGGSQPSWILWIQQWMLWKTQLQLTKLLFPENRVFAFWRKDPRWRISANLDFRGESLKVIRNRITGQIINYLLLVKLFDVEYYRNLEMWVRGHSRQLETVPFESSGTVPILAFHSK